MDKKQLKELREEAMMDEAIASAELAGANSKSMDKTVAVPVAWLQGLQKQASKLEKSLARASLKPDPYTQSELTSLLGYLDSIEFLLK